MRYSLGTGFGKYERESSVAVSGAEIDFGQIVVIAEMAHRLESAHGKHLDGTECVGTSHGINSRHKSAIPPAQERGL